MERIDCLKALVPFIKDQLVVVSLGRTAEEWAEISSHEGTMFDSGMGHHIPVALGLAKALPHRQVIVFDTDGSVLMLLSALPTLGAYPASNLKVFVFDNEAYEGTGSQPSATSKGTDIAAMARGAGITAAMTVSDSESFKAAAESALTTAGLAFIVAKIELSKGRRRQKPFGHKESLIRFVRYVERTENKTIFHTEHS